MLRARFLGTSLWLWLLAAGSSWACQICIPYPKDSLADHLLRASTVALARENPEAPFTLEVTGILAGDPSPPPPDLFLDSQSRRILSLSEEKSIVCVHYGDANPPNWRRIGIDHGELRPLIERILVEAPSWAKEPDERPRFFAPYLRHPDRQIGSLAHLEVARAPYAQIRNLADSIPLDEIRDYLTNIRYAEWHALYILFLAQSKHQEDRNRIIQATRSNAEHSLTLQSAAWATAFIEVRQTDGIRELDRLYFSGSERSLAELEAIQASFSVQGSNAPDRFQGPIIQSYKNALLHRPELAPRIVTDLVNWKSPDLIESVIALLKRPSMPFSPEEVLQLRAYIREYPPPSASPQDDSSSARRSYLWLVSGLLLLPYLLRHKGHKTS